MLKTTYYWDELSDNVVAEYEDGVLSASYTHEPGLYGNLLSQKRNGVTSYYHYDGRGDTVALTDDAGNVTDTKEYDAWGNVIESTGTTVTPHQFAGRNGYQYDVSTARSFVRERLLSSQTGRWSSKDLLGVRDQINEFVYVQNAPTTLVDPSGLSPATQCPISCGGVEIGTMFGEFGSRTFPVPEGPILHEMSANIQAEVRPNVSPCCCDEIWFVQIVHSSWGNKIFAKPSDVPIQVDNTDNQAPGWPYYDRSNMGGVVDYPLMPDGFFAGAAKLGFKPPYVQEFETCAVCIRLSKEGIFSIPVGTPRLLQCMSWGRTFDLINLPNPNAATLGNYKQHLHAPACSGNVSEFGDWLLQDWIHDGPNLSV